MFHPGKFAPKEGESTPDFQLFSTLRYDPLLVSISEYISKGESGEEPLFLSSPYYMLRFHQERMIAAADHFGWPAVYNLHGKDGRDGLLHLSRTLDQALGISNSDRWGTEHVADPKHSTPLRVKVLLNYEGKITVEAGPLPALSQFQLFPKRLPPPRSRKPMQFSPLTGGALTLGDDDAVHGDPERTVPWDILLDTARTPPSSYTTFKTTSRDMYDDARKRVGIKDFSEKKEVLILSDKDGAVMEGSLTTVYFWRDGKWITPPNSSGGQAGTTRRWALENELCVEGIVKVEELMNGEECWISNGARGFMWGKVKLNEAVEA